MSTTTVFPQGSISVPEIARESGYSSARIYQFLDEGRLQDFGKVRINGRTYRLVKLDKACEAVLRGEKIKPKATVKPRIVDVPHRMVQTMADLPEIDGPPSQMPEGDLISISGDGSPDERVIARVRRAKHTSSEVEQVLKNTDNELVYSAITFGITLGNAIQQGKNLGLELKVDF